MEVTINIGYIRIPYNDVRTNGNKNNKYYKTTQKQFIVNI